MSAPSGFRRWPLSAFEGGGIVRDIKGRDTGLTAHDYLADSPMPWLTKAARASGEVCSSDLGGPGHDAPEVLADFAVPDRYGSASTLQVDLAFDEYTGATRCIHHWGPIRLSTVALISDEALVWEGASQGTNAAADVVRTLPGDSHPVGLADRRVPHFEAPSSGQRLGIDGGCRCCAATGLRILPVKRFGSVGGCCEEP